ncbi:hypothetical protein [Streptomyces spiralis]|uniref:hypothetical protein n=1 Tax=Streptomyces spiralis TaxID=66376 RepID=UPI0036B63B81
MTKDTTSVQQDDTGIRAIPARQAGDGARGTGGRPQDTTGPEDTSSPDPSAGPRGTNSPDPSAGPRLRGRHRRPRPRKVLLAAGGLALAAGALSLVRLAPEYAGGGPGVAEPRADARAGDGTGRSADVSATVGAGPAALPSATVPMGGTGDTTDPEASRAASASPSVAAAVPPSPLPDTTTGNMPAPDTVPTTVPEDPNPREPTNPPARQTPTGHSQRPATTRPAPRPTPAPSRSSHAPETPPPSSGGAGLCLPIVGLCVEIG